MARIKLVTPLESDAAVLSGGSWVAGLPLANLQDMQPTNTARSSDATTGSTIIVIDAGSAKAWDTLFMPRTNLSAAATIRIRAATSEANLTAAPGWDSTAISAWPATGRPTDVGLSWFDVFLQLAPGGSFRWWRIDIADTGNADGYVEIGRLVFGTAWQPGRNFGLSWTDDVGAADVRIVTNYGHTLTDPRPRPRLWSLPLRFLTQDEAEDAVYELRRRLGLAGDLVVCLDPDATARLHRKTMLATFEETPVVTQPDRRFHSTTFNLRELI